MVTRSEIAGGAVACFLAALSLSACENTAEKSVAQAKQHVDMLAKAAATDVQEVRKGLPKGAEKLTVLYGADEKPSENIPAVREALNDARNSVQDLRVAKSTFFALAATDGKVLRNDREQDSMAGTNVFQAFPELKEALKGKYVETRGSMKEAAGVTGPDGQWVAADAVEVDGEVKGLYVTGWSWSAYAYRLENQLRGSIKSALQEREKEPLSYVYVVVADAVYGAPVSPQVNAKTIGDLHPLKGLAADAIFTKQLEITGRDFGLAVKRVPALGEDVGIAVLRSET